MDVSGKSLTVINALGEYNSATFAGDKIIIVPNSFITSNPNEIKVYNLSSYSARTLYGDWMGCSCWYKGARFMPDSGVSVYSSTTSVSTIKNIEIQVTEAYFAGKRPDNQGKVHKQFRQDNFGAADAVCERLCQRPAGGRVRE
jgi:hypothetical protein